MKEVRILKKDQGLEIFLWKKGKDYIKQGKHCQTLFEAESA